MPVSRPRALAWGQTVLLTGTFLAALTGTSTAATSVPVPASPSNLPAGVEALQPYVGQSTCDPVAKPGVRAFMNLLLDTYTDTTSLGIVRDCGVGGQSEHKEGRAFDWGANVSNAHQAAEVNAVLSWLLATDKSGNKAANARRFGIMYIIWNKQMWRAYDIDKGWQPYSGDSEHTDHVHFSFGWSGAKEATSWWTGKVAATDYGPGKAPAPTGPVRSPANLLVLATYGSTVLQESTGSSSAKSTNDSAATKVVQTALKITADGDFGPNTTAAVKSFQTAQKLTANGVVDSDDWLALFPKPQVPFGTLDAVSFGIPGTVAVAGWAADADATSPIQVHVYVDGKAVKALTANGVRDDVAAAYPGVGDGLGYTTTLDLADGAHSVCTFAINVGPGSSPQLGCKSVTVHHDPDGFGEVLALGPNALQIKGWAADPDSADPVQIATTVDGKPFATTPAASPRGDVGSRYPAYGSNRGYGANLDLSAVAEGSHTFCSVATNLVEGKDKTLRCVTAYVQHTPFGNVEQLTQVLGDLQLRGWAIEPDTSGPATITGTLDGKAIPSITADQPRGDVTKKYPLFGDDHGFVATLPAPTAEGTHTLCLTVTNAGPGLAQKPMCRTVTVNHTPFGVFDAASVKDGLLTVNGWAIDPDTADSIQVHVTVDGKLFSNGTASGARPDLVKARPGYGPAHGYALTSTSTLAKGTHRVCVFAINAGAGTHNPGLSCRNVTAP